jgi:DNA-binding transcriptional ArsR family regulator
MIFDICRTTWPVVRLKSNVKSYRHPAIRSVPLSAVMQALSDPWRLKIVRHLAKAGDTCETCGDVDMTISKATRSHHFQVLREAGLVRMRSDGNKCQTSLRRADLEKRFPGLLDFIANHKGSI